MESSSAPPAGVLRVALVAEESAGASVLKRLLVRGHDVVCVVSGGRGGLGSPVVRLAQQHGRTLRPPADVRRPAFASWLAEQQVDLLLNVHSLVIVAAEVVEAPRLGSFNLHPGPLPHYAGLNVPSWAVLHRERRHGVTLHRMTTTVDAGAVVYEDAFDVGPQDTALSVFSTCIRAGCGLVDRLLNALERGERLPEHPQDPSWRRWFGAGPPDDGLLRWDRSAEDVLAFVRACDYGPFPSPWGHPRCPSPFGEVEVVRAAPTDRAADAAPGTVGPVDEQGALVAAADTWVLVQQVLLDGRRRAPQEVLRPGLVLGREAAHA